MVRQTQGVALNHMVPLMLLLAGCGWVCLCIKVTDTEDEVPCAIISKPDPEVLLAFKQMPLLLQ